MPRTKNKEVRPPIVPEVMPIGSDSPPVVEGHRLVERKERFVVDGPQHGTTADTRVAVQPPIEALECGLCDYPIQPGEDARVDPDEGLCHVACLEPDATTEIGGTGEALDEAELLFETLGPEREQYTIRVEHLTNFHVDGKADSKAQRKFCRSLKGAEINLDYLETVRRSCRCKCLAPGDEGEFSFIWFDLSGKPRIKKRWHESVTKPSNEEITQTTHAAQPASNGFQSFTQQAREFAEIAKAFGLTPRGQVQQPEQQALPAKPADPFETIDIALGLVDKVKSRLTPETPAASVPTGEGRRWVTELVTLARESGLSTGLAEFMAPVGGVLGSLVAEGINDWRAKKTQQAAGAIPEKAGAPPQRPRGSLPTPAIGLVRQIVAEMNADAPIERSVGICVMVLQQAGEKAWPFFEDMLAKSPTDLVMWISEQLNEKGEKEWAYLPKVAHASIWANNFREALREATSPDNTQQPDNDEPTETGEGESETPLPVMDLTDDKSEGKAS